MLEITRHYLYAVPEVLSHLLRDLSPSSPVWDRRPDPERFTLREITAHLADWDPVFVGKIDRIRAELTLQGLFS